MSIDIKDDKKREYFTIKIPRPRNLERIFYITIIIVLLFFLFVSNPFPQLTCKSCGMQSDLTAAVVDDNGTADADTELSAGSDDSVADTDTETNVDDAAADGDTDTDDSGDEAEGTNNDDAAADADTSTDDTSADDEDTSEEDDAPVMSVKKGQIGYSIVDVETAIKNKGTASEYGRITAVTYKIENNKENIDDFTIKVYAYDDDSSDLSGLERAEDTFTISEGEVIEETIELKSGSFKKLDEKKMLKVKFFDGGTWLKTIDKEVLIT